MATASPIPSYAHNGLKVYVLSKEEDSAVDEDDFFARLYENLNEDFDDISFTGSFQSPSLNLDQSPVKVMSTAHLPKYINNFDELASTKVDMVDERVRPLTNNQPKVDTVDEGVRPLSNNQSQTDVSLVDEQFLLRNSKYTKEIETSEKSVLTDAVGMRHASSETTSLPIAHRSISTDPVQFVDDDMLEILKNDLSSFELENVRLRDMLDQMKINSLNQPAKSNISNTGIQTTETENMSTGCQATTINIDANCQTASFSKDVASQHSGGIDSQDELSERQSLELTIQQNQLAADRQLRAKIGEIDLLESRLSEAETSRREALQLNENLQQQLKYLGQQIEEKEELIGDLESMRKSDEKIKEQLSSDAGSDAQLLLQQQLSASEMRERDLISRIDELLKRESTLKQEVTNAHEQYQLKYDQLKQQYDDLHNSSNHLKSSLLETKANIKNLNILLHQKDDQLKNLWDKNNLNKENLSPNEKRVKNDLDPVDDEIQNILKDLEAENISPAQYSNKKRMPIKNIVEVGRGKNRYFELKLYEDLKQQYLNKTPAKYHNIHPNIPTLPSNFRCLKQKNGKLSLVWQSQPSHLVQKYRICINDSRTITIENTGSGKVDLILDQSELTRSTLRLNLCGINAEGMSSNAALLTITNLFRSRSTNDLSASPQQKTSCIAVYDYAPSGESRDLPELKLETGDFVETFGPLRPDGFFRARVRGTETVGLVPKHFIQQISQFQMPFLK